MERGLGNEDEGRHRLERRRAEEGRGEEAENAVLLGVIGDDLM